MIPPLAPGARIHLLGAAGTAMASLAGLLSALGYRVSGSDERAYPPMSTLLEALGIPLRAPFAAANLPADAAAVVVGNAVSRGNPELEAALDRGDLLVSFPETLRELVLRERRPAVVAGTHGKTTTTSLLAWILRTAGRDIGYLVGGVAPDLGGSFRPGAPGEPFVVEGDEYDTAYWDKGPKFLHYLPEVAVVGNVEFDHADIYPDFAAVRRAFSFLARLPPRRGLLLLGADSPAAAALAEYAHTTARTFGLSEGADWRGVPESSGPSGTRLAVRRGGEALAPLEGRFWGDAGCRNLLAAAAAADWLGAPWEAVREAAASFRGVARRLEVLSDRGEGRERIVVARDFAHHPTAVASVVEAAGKRWPGARIVAVFEPRSFTARSRVFQEEFAAAFRGAAAVLLSGAPEGRGRPPREASRLDLPQLAEALAAECESAAVAETPEDLVERAVSLAEAAPPTVLLFLSNGHFAAVPEQAAARLRG